MPVLEDFRREIDISLAAYAKTETASPCGNAGRRRRLSLHGLLGYLRSMP